MEPKLPYYRYYQDIAATLNRIDEALNTGAELSLKDLANSVPMTQDTLQRAFTSLVGISPKRYYQYKLMQKAEPLIVSTDSNLELSLELGLSSTSRLHDLFINISAMTPAEWASRGSGVELYFGKGASPFGDAEIIWSGRGIVSLVFTMAAAPSRILQWQKDWSKATYREDNDQAQIWLNRIFKLVDYTKPLSLWLKGTNFQLNVWQALLNLEEGTTSTYQAIAKTIDNERAVRAVGTAIGANPIGYLIPCHRVIRSDGAMGGYRWGVERKQVMLANEFSKACSARGAN